MTFYSNQSGCIVRKSPLVQWVSLSKYLSTLAYLSFFFADIDVHSGVVQTQAGVILEKLDAQLGEHGLMAPLDLGAKGRFFDSLSLKTKFHS